MGLDMYLIAKKSNRKSIYRNEEIKKPRELQDFNVDFQTTKEIYDIGYWRKANHIRGLIVDLYGNEYEDGNQVIELDKGDFEEMLYTLEQVKDDHSLAEELLPRTDGFFFGDQEYDEDYYREIDYTIDLFKKVIKLLEEDSSYEICYEESW